MIKRTMLAAIATALAFAAIPALATANPHINKEGVKFTVSGETANLTGTNNEGGTVEVHCRTTEGVPALTGSGSFDAGSKVTGKISLTFHDCRGPLNVTCTTPGDPSGTVTASGTFHLKTVNHGGKTSPAVLIKPTGGEGAQFAEFKCSFLATIKVKGNGIIGTIEANYNEELEKVPVSFEKDAENPHTQTHRFVTDSETEYNLSSSLNGGEYRHASETATGTLEFEEKVKLTE